jgi:hypothetical protein
MEKKEQIEAEFLQELQELLRKWDATLEAEDHFVGYPECGQDIRMTVYIPQVYDGYGNIEREGVEINLGKFTC